MRQIQRASAVTDRAGGSPRRCRLMRGIPTSCTPIGWPADGSPATTRWPGLRGRR